MAIPLGDALPSVSTFNSSATGSKIKTWRYSHYWEYDANVAEGDSVNVVYYTDNSRLDLLADNTLWCFTGNQIDGFKIYNKVAGAGVYIIGNKKIVDK